MSTPEIPSDAPHTPDPDEALVAAARAGWNACRKSVYAVCKSVYAVCEDVRDEAEKHVKAAPDGAQHDFGRGMDWAGKSIARGFNSMEADDDDNFRAALAAMPAPDENLSEQEVDWFDRMSDEDKRIYIRMCGATNKLIAEKDRRIQALEHFP